jgi:hypothetical protein
MMERIEATADSVEIGQPEPVANGNGVAHGKSFQPPNQRVPRSRRRVPQVVPAAAALGDSDRSISDLPTVDLRVDRLEAPPAQTNSHHIDRLG